MVKSDRTNDKKCALKKCNVTYTSRGTIRRDLKAKDGDIEVALKAAKKCGYDDLIAKLEERIRNIRHNLKHQLDVGWIDLPKAAKLAHRAKYPGLAVRLDRQQREGGPDAFRPTLRLPTPKEAIPVSKAA
jgi:hypothetical protein